MDEFANETLDAGTELQSDHPGFSVSSAATIGLRRSCLCAVSVFALSVFVAGLMLLPRVLPSCPRCSSVSAVAVEACWPWCSPLLRAQDPEYRKRREMLAQLARSHSQ